MGRLRHDEDFGFLSSIATEVVDLFGTDATLYRFFEAPGENVAVRDPLYDEPGLPNTVQRKAFNIKLHWQISSFAHHLIASRHNLVHRKSNHIWLLNLFSIGAGGEIRTLMELPGGF